MVNLPKIKADISDVVEKVNGPYDHIVVTEDLNRTLFDLESMRCENCKYWKERTGHIPSIGECSNLQIQNMITVWSFGNPLSSFLFGCIYWESKD